MNEKRFPIQAAVRRVEKPGPRSVSWSTAEIAYGVYSSRYGSEQSLERLAERGGFGCFEMDEYCPDWREREDELAHLRHTLDTVTAERDALNRPGLPYAIVKGIWDDMSDRSGFDLGALDNELRSEIQCAWMEIVRKALTPAARDALGKGAT